MRPMLALLRKYASYVQDLEQVDRMAKHGLQKRSVRTDSGHLGPVSGGEMRFMPNLKQNTLKFTKFGKHG